MGSVEVGEPLPVVCLILVDRQGRILATRRPSGKRLAGFWEFPGGKVEPGEAPSDALRREIREELAIELGPLRPLPSVAFTYPYAVIRLMPFIAECEDPPCLSLNEHSAAMWLWPEDWQRLAWAPADVPVLRKWLDGLFA